MIGNRVKFGFGAKEQISIDVYIHTWEIWEREDYDFEFA